MAEFTWGDEVRVRADAPPGCRPGAVGAVCGWWTVNTKAQASKFGVVVGTALYTVEFGDGSSLELPAIFLERAGGG